MLAFQPQALAAISPTVSAEEAVHRLLGTSRIDDLKLYANEDWSEVRFEGGPTPSDMARYGAARHVVLDALRSAELHAYLWKPGRLECLEIPRLYWIHRDELSFGKPFKGGADIIGWTADVDGSLPIFSGRELDNWIATGSRRVDSLVQPAPPIPAQQQRVRPPTAKQKGVADFVRYAEALERPMFPMFGAGFFRAYEAWCRKNMRPRCGHSAFHEVLRRIRSESALASANDNPNRR
jgi:hypothetical protein